MSDVRQSKEDGDDSKADTSGPNASSVEESKVNPLEEYYKLPPLVRRRVRALKKLQYETMKVDAAFYKELFELEMKYDIQHQHIFDQRREIVTGQREPVDEECDWPSDNENVSSEGDEVEKLCDDVQKKAGFQTSNSGDTEEKGIPEFWLKAMKNVSLLDEMIKEHDVEILKHLTDIKCVLHNDEPGFTIEFYFSANKYFTNKVLTKRYFFNYDISPDEPFEYEGPEIIRARGCAINWNPGKNVTVKLIKKVQKKKSGNAKRTITKSVQEDSFFNFFAPPTEALTDDLDEDTQFLLEADFKLGQFIRDSIIPRAVLYFTGEAVDSDFEDEDEEDEDDDDDDDDEDDDEEEENEGHKHHQRHNRGHHQKRSGNAASREQPECKQQ